jgi:hypothetical protein
VYDGEASPKVLRSARPSQVASAGDEVPDNHDSEYLGLPRGSDGKLQCVAKECTNVGNTQWGGESTVVCLCGVRVAQILSAIWPWRTMLVWIGWLLDVATCVVFRYTQYGPRSGRGILDSHNTAVIID